MDDCKRSHDLFEKNLFDVRGKTARTKLNRAWPKYVAVPKCLIERNKKYYIKC